MPVLAILFGVRYEALFPTPTHFVSYRLGISATAFFIFLIRSYTMLYKCSRPSYVWTWLLAVPVTGFLLLQQSQALSAHEAAELIPKLGVKLIWISSQCHAFHIKTIPV